ncbi:MAG: hypothetical protein K6B65_04120 [Bacilli bacterium]|nr:hypothetical protein [Bacilli bacterium]
MSEIKGQLLGMLMVLVVFALVGGVLYTSFRTSVSTVSTKMEEEASLIADM